MENKENVTGKEPRTTVPRTTKYDLNTNQDQSNENRLSSNAKTVNQTEINPSKLDQNEVDLDRDGVDNAKGDEVYEFGQKESDTGAGEGAQETVRTGEQSGSPSPGNATPRAGLNSQGSTQRAPTSNPISTSGSNTTRH